MKRATRTPARDVYVEWARLSGFAGFTNNRFFRWQRPGDRRERGLKKNADAANAAPTADEWVSFIAKAADAATIDAIALDTGAKRPGAFAYVPLAYRQDVPGTEGRSLFFTGRVRRRDLGRLARHPGIEDFELGLPVAVPDAGEPDEKAPDLRQMNARRADRESARDVIAVIDYGAAILHDAFAREAGTRLHHYWDQGLVRGKGWLSSSSFGYGSVLEAPSIDDLRRELAQRRARGDGCDEEVAYRQLGMLHFRARFGLHIRRTSHGTHVLDVAGGRLDPWTGREDEASRASLVFVDLPFHTAADGSGGSLSVHLLDGVRDVLACCADDARVVVSISQGTHAGPHDGSTLIERALDDLLARRPRDFFIVIGAGNARHSQGHVRADVAPGETVLLALDIPQQDLTDTFVECWYPRVAEGEGSDLEIGAQAPDRAPVFAASGKLKAPCRPDGEPGRREPAALIHHSFASNGNDALALLALGPADPGPGKRRGGVAVAPGRWHLYLRNRGRVTLPVDCYVERDEPVRPPALAYPKFVEPHPERAEHAGARPLGPAEAGTLNTLCTGRHTIAVGACFRGSGEPSPYSSLGPVRGGPQAGHPVPMVLAAADESHALPGLRAAAVRSGDSFRMNGTSVAAPALARRLFCRMMRRPGLRREDTREIVRALAAEDGDGLFFLPAG